MTAPAKPAESKAVAKIDPKEYDRPPANGIAGLQRLAGPLLPQIASAMPGLVAKNAERMVRALFTECQKTPALLDCTPKSLFGAVVQVAQLGLELGGPTGHAYLLPFGKKAAGVTEATLVIGYRGFIALAFRAGVQNFTPRTVHKGDTFGIEYGTAHRIVHVPRFESTDPIGYYAIVRTPTGGLDFEYMTHAEAEAHRARYALSKSGGAWATSFDEMAKKTCVRKLAKRVPLSPEWVAAAALDESADEDVPQHLGAVVMLGEADGVEGPNLRERLDRAKGKEKREARPEERREDNGIDEPPGELFDNTAPTKLPD